MMLVIMVYLSVVLTYIRARVVHAHYPRVPYLIVRKFDVRIAQPEARTLAQRASARHTRT